MTEPKLHSYRMSIDGESVAGSASLSVIDPATAAPFARVPDCTRQQLDSAVAAAQRAFATWSDETLDERRRLVNAFIERVVADADTLAPLITREQGKPLAKARSEINSAVFFRAAIPR
jgi:acyl-CoA reductase-like NAD-dependent aldehyde dehydrogenase